MFLKDAPQNREYRKLPGTRKGFMVGKFTLWQGRDHLLHIYSRFGVEDYKRFYLSDIQAIVARRTKVGSVQNLILGFFLCLFALAAISVDRSWVLFHGIIAAAMLVLLVINLLRGPTCETKLMTAVQTEKLHSLHRLKNASRVMDRLRPIIEQVQGTLKPTDLNKAPFRRIDDETPHHRNPATTHKKARTR